MIDGDLGSHDGIPDHRSLLDLHFKFSFILSRYNWHTTLYKFKHNDLTYISCKMITTISLVDIYHLGTSFLKGRHLSFVCISETLLEILNHFLCVNLHQDFKKQKQKAETRFLFKILWFSEGVPSSSPHLYIAQKIVTLKGNRIEGWYICYFSLRHPHRWYVQSKMLCGTKGKMSRDYSAKGSEWKRSLNGVVFELIARGIDH